MADPVVELRGARKTYGSTVAVEGLDLAIPSSATFALLGPNGSGKTTTIRMILRIQEPDAGQVRIFGRPPGPGSLDRVGYLPEERGLYPKMTVRDILVFLAELKRIPPKEGRGRVERWLERVGLADRAGDTVESLSKGMQQKLQFIAAVVHDPELVILDEPFSGLDPINQQALRDIVADLRREGRTILFSTHIIEHAERLCDHVCILARGRAVAHGSVGEVKREHGERYVALGLETWSAVAEAAVREAPGVGGVTHDGAAFEIRLVDGAAPQALLRHLVERGVDVRRFEVMEPTLHQVFLERVGRPPVEMEAPTVA
ncbi:MAG: ATP-binding cassette domain-containing protein [Gemmatimonadetes bacterium]|nr:ATP-binding cassette domain-containing protein [Gemmatimonadota bacterium]